MDRQPVKSSNIKEVGHDPENNVLEVQFKDGSVYQYQGVDADQHAALVGAKSIGAHLHQNIRGKFKHSKLDNS